MATRLVDSCLTLVFDGRDGGRPLQLEPHHRPRPCFVWKDGSGLVATFRAEAAEPNPTPAPGNRVAAVLGIHPSQIPSGREGVDLLRLLANGAFIRGADLPQPAVAHPGGTARYLCRYLWTLAGDARRP